MSLGNAGNQVRASGQRQCRREAADDGGYVTFHAVRHQRVINQALVRAPPRDMDVPRGRVAGKRHAALAQRVPGSHHPDEAVSQQRLRTHLRTGGRIHHTRLQIDGPLAQRRTVLVELRYEAQSHPGCVPRHASQQRSSEVLHEPFAAPKGERSVELLEVEPGHGSQCRLRILHQLTDTFAKFQRSG